MDSSEKFFSCDICQKSFTIYRKYNIHKKKHTGHEKHYKCDICGKYLSNLVHLRNHKRLHTGVRPFPCTICSKRFCEKGSLTIHMRNHTGEAPYSCNICTKSFSKSSSLKSHQRVHTSERPYTCNECKSSFKNIKSLTIHKRKHTGENPFPCDVCKKSFHRKDYLKRHKCKAYSNFSFNELDNIEVRFRTAHASNKIKTDPFVCEVDCKFEDIIGLDDFSEINQTNDRGKDKDYEGHVNSIDNNNNDTSETYDEIDVEELKLDDDEKKYYLKHSKKVINYTEDIHRNENAKEYLKECKDPEVIIVEDFGDSGGIHNVEDTENIDIYERNKSNNENIEDQGEVNDIFLKNASVEEALAFFSS